MRVRDFAYFDRPFIALAHRGGALTGDDVGRENSLFAFSRAVQMGYRHLETDVHATSDGHLVAFHDPTLDRVTDATGAIAQLPLSVVQQARIGGIDPVPTLDELLETFPEQCFNIDIKAPGAVEPLATTIGRHAAWGRVCVGSFHPSSIARFRRLTRGRVATSVGPVGVAWNAWVPVLPRLLNSSGVAFQMPVDHLFRGRRVRMLTPWLLDSAHRRGKVVHVWTINDPDQMNQLIDLGVDGLVSDRIDLLKEVLADRGMWLEA